MNVSSWRYHGTIYIVFLLLMVCFIVLGWWMVKVSYRALQGFSFAHFKWWSKSSFFVLWGFQQCNMIIWFGLSIPATLRVFGYFYFYFLICCAKLSIYPHRQMVVWRYLVMVSTLSVFAEYSIAWRKYSNKGHASY